MTAAGIICEYNPFHNGHLYHIRQTRAAGASHILCVMSGNFVQRGEPAILSKHARAAAALACGADLVVELPLPWACASAETFARGAMGILHAAQADWLSFGSECGDETALDALAKALLDEKTAAFAAQYTKRMSYPAAVKAAVEELVSPDLAALLDNPNDTLAAEYLKAAHGIGWNVTPFAVKREQKHDTQELSGLFIREKIRKGEDISRLVPLQSLHCLQEELERGYCPADLGRIERAVLLKMRQLSPEQIAQAPELTAGLENRIFKADATAQSLDELYAGAKTKRYTLAKIRRAVMLSFLGVTEQDAQGEPPYIRVLAANGRGKELLTKIRQKNRLPILTKYSELANLSDRCKRIYALEEQSTEVYAMCCPQIRERGAEMTQKVLFT